VGTQVLAARVETRGQVVLSLSSAMIQEVRKI